MTTTTELPPLSPRQKLAFAFIAQHCRERGYSPTVRDICKHMGMRSPNAGTVHLKALAHKGYLQWEPKIGRTIRPTPAALEATDGSAQ